MYKNILLPIDLGDASSWKAALPAAVELAEKFDSKIHTVTIVPNLHVSEAWMYLPENFEETAVAKTAEKLKEFAAEHVPEKIRGNAYVGHGVIRNEIVNATEKLNCDVVVMAPHRPEMLDFLLSPNTEFVVKHSKRSVIVVRE